MFVRVSNFRARLGEEDAVVALHEEWARSLSQRVAGWLSAELLVGPDRPTTFLRILRFEDEDAARRTESDPEHAAWSRRLASLTADETEWRSFERVWSIIALEPNSRSPA